MLRYNAIVKHYNQISTKNLRFIQFEFTREKATTPQDKAKLQGELIQQKIKTANVPPSNEDGIIRDYKHEAIQRAKRRVKEIIRNNYSQDLKFLTLTYADLCTDILQVKKDLKAMCKRYKDLFGSDLRYIATVEWQKERGCLHLHLLVDTPYILNKEWSCKLWTKGFTFVKTITHGKNTTDCLDAISYVLKYIQKDAESVEGYAHLYFRSRNWNTTFKVDYCMAANEREFKRYCNMVYGNGEYIWQKFFFENFDGEVITIIDVYPLTL